MSFYNPQPEEQKENYIRYLTNACKLSRLFSDNNKPFIHYRLIEKIFCTAFEVDNISRDDSSIDARKGNIGIELKTFLHKNKSSSEKISEFNRDMNEYRSHINNNENISLINRISELRNSRTEETKRNNQVETLIYHYVTRDDNQLHIHEEPMNLIDVPSIQIKKVSSTSIIFTDEQSNYRFVFSKSTLFKHFRTNIPLISIPIVIPQNPLPLLLNLT